MRDMENADDNVDDSGIGDLLDDFVSTAAARVLPMPQSKRCCATLGCIP